jgi:putative Ca2+/H+ antiporter (TMEM165/GDT1 family)
MSGIVVLVTLTLARRHARWRIVTGFVGANLLLNAAMGWCPMSILLHRLGISTAAERALGSDS